MVEGVEKLRLSFLGIENVRNVKQASITPDNTLNVFYGKNGAGKTSILESVTILGRGKGLRSRRYGRPVREGARGLTVVGRVINGRERQLRVSQGGGTTKVTIDEQVVHKVTALVRVLPLRILAENSQRLLEGEPLLRRQYLDWNLFHVEHDYLDLYRRFARTLRQRNAWVRESARGTAVWDAAYVRLSEAVDRRRRQLIDQLQSWLNARPLISSAHTAASLEYLPGWPQGMGLAEALAANRGKEVERGYSLFGPHRADLRVYQHLPTKAGTLSRGEMKFMVLLLQLAAESVQQRVRRRSSIFLLDDLGSEWDAALRGQAIELLLGSGCQLFVTLLEGDEGSVERRRPKMFHVEHGAISPGCLG